MLRDKQRKLLSLFADAQKHSFFETCLLARIMFKESDRKVERRFKSEILEHGWLRRLWESPFFHLDFYVLTKKGDRCFRADKLARLDRHNDIVSEEAKRHYRYFTRKAEGKYGTFDLGKKITEKEARKSSNYKLPGFADLNGTNGTTQ